MNRTDGGLQAGPSSKPVRHALILARPPCPREVQSFGRKPILHCRQLLVARMGRKLP